VRSEISNREITRWEDPRPKPSWDEIMFTIEKIKELEDAVPTILLPEQARPRLRTCVSQIERRSREPRIPYSRQRLPKV
jgi:tRNA uridine 5-carbamoylmethylation protein Kti12